MCADISVVDSNTTSGPQIRRMVSTASVVVVSNMPIFWGKRTKTIVMEAFKDIHMGWGTLGPSLHIGMRRNVAPIQAHPQWCLVVKGAKAAEAIVDLEKQDILEKVNELTA